MEINAAIVKVQEALEGIEGIISVKAPQEKEGMEKTKVIHV